MAIDIQNTVIDVIYDEDVIYHVLAPNTEGVRGVPVGQFFLRDKISTAQNALAHLDQTKIDEYITELEREQNSGQIQIS